MAKICILCADMYEDLELHYPRLRLIEAGHDVVVAGPEKTEYKSKHGYAITTDSAIREIKADDYDAFVVPGGFAPDFLRRTDDAAKLIHAANEKGKLLAAICHGGWVLASAEVLEGKRMTGFFAIRHDLIHAGADWVDESCVVDGNLISARNPNDLPNFMKAILDKLG